MEMIYGTKPAASPELCPHVIEAMRKVRRVMYPIYSLHNVDFPELVAEQDLTQVDSLSYHVDFILSDAPYYVLSGRKDSSSHYDISILKAMSRAVAVRKLC